MVQILAPDTSDDKIEAKARAETGGRDDSFADYGGKCGRNLQTRACDGRTLFNDPSKPSIFG